MTILCLETSTKVCSVALAANEKVLALRESADEKYSHAENLTVYIDSVCKEAGIALKEIDAVAVSKGPGSFTGLRIGVSAAKGLCYALNKPLIAINSLEAMAVQASRLTAHVSNQKCFIPMIDAKRMEVYCAVYDENLNELFPTSAEIIDENFLKKISSPQYAAGNTQYYYFGDGAQKCKAIISDPNAVFIDSVNPSAQYMAGIASNYFSEKKFEDLAYFEPFYLKDFVSSSAR